MSPPPAPGNKADSDERIACRTDLRSSLRRDTAISVPDKTVRPAQQPDEATQQEPLPQEKPAVLEEALEDTWGRAPAVQAVSPAASDIRFGRLEASGATVTLAGRCSRRFSRSALMGNRREVQNAIVIATILGPCRAFEAHDVSVIKK